MACLLMQINFGETPYIEELNKRLRKAHIQKSGLSIEEILSCYERMKLDKKLH